jgi:hypothetical protein
VVIPVSFVAIHIHENPRLSPIDEPAQFDYVSRIAQGSVPRLGQSFLPSTLHVVSCTGYALGSAGIPPCPGTRNPRSYPGDGYQYEAQQPPTYYALTVPIRWIGIHLFGLSILTATRLAGALWLALGLLTLWMAARLLRISIRCVVPIVLLLATAPVAIYHASIVSNDAPALFAGSLMALLGTLAWQRPGPWRAPTLLASAFVVTSFKLDDILAVLVVSGVLAAASWSAVRRKEAPIGERLRSWFLKWRGSGGMLLAGGIISALAWVIINRHLNLVDPKTLPTFADRRKGTVDLSLIANESVQMLNPLTGSYHPFHTNAVGATVASSFSLRVQTITATVAECLLLVGGLAGFFVRPRRWPQWTGILSLLILYVGGIGLGLAIWRTYDADPGVTGRYGLCVAPLLALALGATLRRQWAIYGMWIFSVVTVGATYFYLLAR